MTGIEYFQKYGWSHAVQSVSRIPSEYNEYSPDLKTVVVNGNFRYAMARKSAKRKLKSMLLSSNKSLRVKSY
uniref:hypothetical protein n=1 Tax=Acinetobacter gerneri TaxID=202952 RepID=UPI00293BA87F|nr:hypothetical protein [Acinetobacter gerneri]WNL65445.1 hypothetical protein GPGIFMOB_00396 [Acinetobacter gerneri]